MKSDQDDKFNRFIGVVRKLRSAGGCPWDRKQTPESLKRYLLEETEEALKAIDSKDPEQIRDELGDILYIIVLLAQIHSEKNSFDMEDVVDSINAKMIRRHPHVFENEKIESVEDLRERWLEIKRMEKRAGSGPKKIDN